MKVMIIGSSGQIGTYIRNDLLKYKYNIVEINKPKIDVTKFESLHKQIINHKPEIIINCAAYTNVTKAETEPNIAYLINEKYIQNLVILSNELNIKLLNFSSDYVFDGKKNIPYNENDLINPINIYGKSKAAGDQIIISKSNNYILIRTSWVFSGTKHCFLKKIYNQLLIKDHIYVDDKAIGSPTYAGHISELIMNILKKDGTKVKKETFNFTSNPAITWFGFAKKFHQFILKKNIKMQKKVILKNDNSYKDLVIRPKNSLLNCSKVFKEYSQCNFLWQESFKEVYHNILNDN